MKRLKKLCSLFLLISILIATVGVIPASAADMGSVDAKEKQKIVAVIYDDSGSMIYDSKIGGYVDEHVNDSGARYALGNLISLMSEDDIMTIIPMNGIVPQNASERAQVFSDKNTCELPVDLSGANQSADYRNKLVESILSNPLIKPDKYKNTPSGALPRSIKFLERYGLQTDENLAKMDPDKEYWLVILTDGAFNYDSKGNQKSATENFQIDCLKQTLAPYTALNTVYVSFGAGAYDLTQRIKNDSVLGKLKISSFCKVEPGATGGGKDLVSVIQTISNDISGRYSLQNTKDTEYYKVEGNTLTVDISKLPFSLASLSVVAQDCGGRVSGTPVYDGAAPELGDVTISLKNECTLNADKILGLKSGCSFEVIPSSYLHGGKLVINFTAGSDLSNVSILAKPSLKVSYFVETYDGKNWVRTDLSDISENCRTSDKVCVGYEVIDPVTGLPLDLEKIFGDVDAKVDYVKMNAGKTEKTVFGMGSAPRSENEKKAGEVFELVKGTNELSVRISMMDGAYNLRDSTIIMIRDKVEIVPGPDSAVEGESPKAKGSFKVKINGMTADAKMLEEYKLALRVSRGSSGTLLEEQTVTPSASGEISAAYDITTNNFDTYVFTLSVTDSEGGVDEGSFKVTYAPDKLDTPTVTPSVMEKTQYELVENKDSFVFTLTVNGKEFPFDNGITDFTLKVGGVDVSEYTRMSGSTLTYVPSAESLGKEVDTPGDKTVLLEITSDTHPNLNTRVEAKLTVIKTEFAVVPLDTPNKTIDRFDLPNCSATLAFALNRDGIPMSYDEMLAVKDKFTVENTPFFDFFLFPAGMEWDIEEIDGAGALVVKAFKDMPRYFEWHFSAFITGSDKTITVSYPGAETGVDAFVMKDSSIIIHILRIFCLILAIAIATYLILYIIGFFVAKPLPRGVFIRIGSTGRNEQTYVNDTAVPIILWHLKRFISPTELWKNQPFDSQIPDCDGIDFTHTKDGFVCLEPTVDNKIFEVEIDDACQAAIDELHEAIDAGAEGDFPRILANNHVKNVNNVFRIPVDGGAVDKETGKMLSNEIFVGSFLKNGKKMAMMYVVEFRTLY